MILAATAAVTALPEPRCGARGQGCWKIKRAGDALADALAEPTIDTIEARCDLAGGACHKARMLARDLAETVAAVQDDPEAYFNSLNLEDADTVAEKRSAEPEARCGARGQGCWKEKRVAVSEAEAEADPEARCGARGQGCWKMKREAVPEPEARCGARGQGCWKVKRAAEAIAAAVADAEPRCGARGQGCWKEKRDHAALQNAAREALAAVDKL
jgi:hypothetical protein